ncbi:amidohydrolase [Rhizobium sp. KVB221]|uniref:Amidohydrolase n=1 Tax=Rhizobium setariae TaxID=2801340 RepID=A0A937CPT6_9HYPH|nr:amidohydrolase [Rhizobium setariae]MBL0372187.1 amidohydrolase [Rhizobium setariae]
MSNLKPLLILNAKVLTMDPDSPRAEAVYAEGGRIVGVGTNGEMQALAGADAQVIDAKGSTLIPGFSENHLHLFSGSAELDHLQLGGVFGFEALKEKALAYAAARPEETVLYAQGADYTIMGAGERLTRQHLDRIIADRPFAIVAYDHHTVWANTKALELAGLMHGRKLGPGNEVVMGEDGLATGELREMEAFGPVFAASGFDRYRLGLSTGGEPDPYPVGAEWEKDILVMRRGLDYCARHGFTSLQCMDGNLYQLQLLAEIEKRDGFLPCRVQIPFHLKNFMPLSMLEKASDMAATYKSEFLSSGVVKMFYDGVLESWTAVMVEPYANKPDSLGGPSLFTAQEMKAAVVEIDRRGLQVAVHAIGDGAVRAVLDGVEAAEKANGKRDSRHRIEHIEVVHPDDISRFGEMGIIASMQPPHPPGAMGLPLEPTVSMIGRERWPYAYAWRTLKNAGAHIPFASDWPVSPIDPLHGIQAAVTRKKWAESDPDQSFSLEEAIAAYTSEGAYAEFKEGCKGMIRKGYFADLTLLDSSIEDQAMDRIAEIRPAVVVCAGRVTYQA